MSLLAGVILAEVLPAEVLLMAELEMVLAVSELMEKRGTILQGSVTLEKEEALLFSNASLVTGTLRTFSLWLARLGGISSHFGTSGLCRFASLLI